MAFVDELGSILTSAGVCSSGASSTGWTLRYRDLEPLPAQLVAVIPSGGLDGEQVVELDYPSAQVIVRGSSGAAGELETQVAAVNAALHRYSGTVNGRVYVNIARKGDVQWMGRDQNQRPMYSLNFSATRSRTT